ncbi:hypothetical protein WA556_003482, partial [Blastocystis sp. ATCC 50177/Nand II]
MDAFGEPGARISVTSKSSFLSRIRLRAYRKSDVDVVRELFNISFPIHYDDTLYEAMVRGTYQERELVSVVAECMVGDAPEIIGCVLFQERALDRSDIRIPMLANDDCFAYVTYILNIAVFPKYRRYGVGSCFLQRVIKRYSGEPLCGGVYLHTLSDSAQNISFYQSNGFQRVQVNEDFYFIDGDWKNSILFFYPLHGARAVENPLNSASSPTCVYALLIT